jgi:hypothetical protein
MMSVIGSSGGGAASQAKVSVSASGPIAVSVPLPRGPLTSPASNVSP